MTEAQTDSIHDETGPFDPGLDLEDEGARDRFRLADDGQATWAMRRLARIQAQMTRVRNIADAERQRIQAWEERQLKANERDHDYFSFLLTEYASGERAAHDRKTIDTPFGVVKSRSGQPVWEVNADEFLDWATEHAPELVKVKASPALSEMKKALTVEETETLGLVAMTKDGEVVPGVQIQPGQVGFTIEITN